ncbi:MAG TPA: hypothetical protein PKC18_06050, partial [Lacipirellulaceae bacterium]|nr:hypothetical protein [Lacipirellulaceae bacterium]
MTFGGLTTPHSDFTDILPLYIGYVLRQLQNAYIISLGRLQAIWPATSRGPLSAELLMHQRLLLGLLLTAGGFVASDRAQGTLFTVNFAGVMQSATPLHNVGDTFSGSFTLETSAALIVHPDTSFDFQSLAIQAAHVGTGWTATFNSTAIAPFTLTGTTGVISIGNNTSFGDRYNVRLTGTTTPLGTFQDFQLD